MLRVGKKYADEEAATYLYGNSAKKELLESPFVRYLNYGQGKDGYWTYKHMVLQIEDCRDCLLYLYPQFDYRFELDHSSGQNAERIDGLSTSSINLGWGGKQRKMRDSELSDDDIGELKHTRVLMQARHNQWYSQILIYLQFLTPMLKSLTNQLLELKLPAILQL